jgi:hypothetical protein
MGPRYEPRPPEYNAGCKPLNSDVRWHSLKSEGAHRVEYQITRESVSGCTVCEWLHCFEPPPQAMMINDVNSVRMTTWGGTRRGDMRLGSGWHAMVCPDVDVTTAKRFRDAPVVFITSLTSGRVRDEMLQQHACTSVLPYEKRELSYMKSSSAQVARLLDSVICSKDRKSFAIYHSR